MPHGSRGLADIPHRRRGSRSATSVPPPGLLVMSALPPYRVHAADDRIGDATPVIRHHGRVEARAVVTDEGRDAIRLRLHVDGDVGRAGVACRIERRLGDGGNERPQLGVQLRVADHHRLHVHLLGPLDLAGHRIDRVAQPHAGERRRPPVQPRTQVTLLGSGEARHLPR